MDHNMYITPISGLSNLNIATQQVSSEKTKSAIPFEQMLQDAISQVNTTQTASTNDTVGLATGTMDDLHTLTINSTKAELALAMVVQIRNKALDAYTEIMRISL